MKLGLYQVLEIEHITPWGLGKADGLGRRISIARILSLAKQR